MLIGYKRGQTSVVLRVKIFDSSVSTGAGLTGLTSASSGLIISTIADNESTATAYTVAGSTIETITTLGTYATPTATKCRFKEVDSTNHKGIYEIQIADARFAVASAKSLLVSISGATNAAQCDVVIPLRDLDPYDAVRAGLTALPNANAGATGGLPLSVDTSGRVDVLKINGTSQTARDLGASVLISSGTGTGQLDVTSGVVKANATQFAGATVAATTSVTFPAASTVATTTGAVGSVTGNVGGNVVGSVASVTAGVTVSTNNDKTGYSLSASGIQAIWDALTTALTTASSIGKLLVDNLNATISSRLASASITLTGGAVTVGTNNDKTGYSIASGGIGSGAHAAAELNAIADAVLDRNMATGTDSGTDSTTTRTPRQALRALRNKTSIAAGTMTVTKEDDSTASWTAAVTTTAGNPVSAVDPT